MRRNWHWLAVILLTGGFLQGAIAPCLGGQPNILLLLTDDQTWNALGSCNGEMTTPNLDRLTKRGTTFTHAFNQGAWGGAVCLASRAMLITGAPLWRAAAYQKNGSFRDPKALPHVAPQPMPELWPQLMRQAGYETYFSGKWHIDAPVNQVFDHVRHVRPGMPHANESVYQRRFIPGEPDEWSPTDREQGGYWEGGNHWSKVIADDGVDFITQAAERDKPFFMYLAFNAPHDPRQAPEQSQQQYVPADLKVPANFLPEYPFNEAIGVGRTLRDERLAPFPRTPYAVQVNRAEYYAAISYLDEQVGRILDALEKSPQAENTWIFFTSDHGLAVGQHGFMGKQNLYDHSIRVPLIVVGPSVPAGGTREDLVYLQDIMPTTLALAGIERPAHVSFASLLPLITEERTASRRTAIYGGYMATQRMIRTAEFKLLIYPTINRVRLYNVKTDPHEMHDLAGDPMYRPRMDELFAEFRKLQQEVEDPLDVSGSYEAFFEGNR